MGLVTPNPVKEAQICAHPSQVRRADVCGCRLAGHLLGSLLGLLAAVLTARLVLMTSGSRLLASVASAATAATTSGRHSRDNRRRFFLLVNGCYQAGLLAIQGPQLRISGLPRID